MFFSLFLLDFVFLFLEPFFFLIFLSLNPFSLFLFLSNLNCLQLCQFFIISNRTILHYFFTLVLIFNSFSKFLADAFFLDWNHIKLAKLAEFIHFNSTPSHQNVFQFAFYFTERVSYCDHITWWTGFCLIVRFWVLLDQ